MSPDGPESRAGIDGGLYLWEQKEAMSQLRVFISSVQKELALERAAIATVISTDPFLQKHCVPVLFEMEPAPVHPAPQPYLKALRGCAIYVLLIAREYGHAEGEISATHHELRLARFSGHQTNAWRVADWSLPRTGA
jgi:hypothetical protein